jgi:hippurate hydrolase
MKEEVRQRALASIRREVMGEALAAGAGREPYVEVTGSQPPLLNDPVLTGRAAAAASRALGAQNVVDMGTRMPGEDFSHFGQAGAKVALLHFGAVAPERLQESQRSGVPLPIPHSPRWAPEYQPALKAAMTAQAAILLDLLQRADVVVAR